MGKALVIPNVDFAANALTNVTLEQDVPCTAISLSDSTLSLTSLEPATLTATVTPVNTTDALTWASSDQTVATVVNGVVTPLRGGSVTITASCGAQSATCAVIIKEYLSTDWELTYYYSLASGGSGNTVKVDGGTSSSAAISIITDGSGVRAYDSTPKLQTYSYPMYVPSGASSIKITVPNQSIRVSPVWCSSEGTTTYGPGYPTVKEYVQPWATSFPAGDRTIPVYEGADCFWVNVYLSGESLTTEMLYAISIEVLYN